MSLKLSKNTIDLGQVKNKQPKSFSVQLINDGNIDIPITEIKLGCNSCTQASVNTKVVKAHSSEPLNIVFTPKSTGINRKTVTINNAVILTFTAQVI